MSMHILHKPSQKVSPGEGGGSRYNVLRFLARGKRCVPVFLKTKTKKELLKFQRPTPKCQRYLYPVNKASHYRLAREPPLKRCFPGEPMIARHRLLAVQLVCSSRGIQSNIPNEIYSFEILQGVCEGGGEGVRTYAISVAIIILSSTIRNLNLQTFSSVSVYA